MVEMTICIVLLLTLTLGFVDFGYAFYQWNAANKAVQMGARLASISNTIAPQIASAGPNAVPGDPISRQLRLHLQRLHQRLHLRRRRMRGRRLHCCQFQPHLLRRCHGER
ncbi:TadE/TadG family type IV pilus assembly protein (plasmid) [Mesorhizobium sp. AaZ16]|uniref:TadE/TadG family type IV pilus assembly protein n=1 Tax=Mesorhizobium sp. AaZ16 TaxID=3402289 RepID=UPI00374E51BE